MTVEELKTQLSSLPEPDRAELAYFLLETLDESDLEIDADFEAELDRRMAEVKGGKVSGKPAEEVFAELRKKYS